jgi:prevent-host-death family protein
MGARDISISELRQKLAGVLTRVKRGETVLVTQHGAVVARIEPARSAQAEAAARIEALRQRVRLGDVLAPIDATWGAAHGEGAASTAPVRRATTKPRSKPTTPRRRARVR